MLSIVIHFLSPPFSTETLSAILCQQNNNRGRRSLRAVEVAICSILRKMAPRGAVVIFSQNLLRFLCESLLTTAMSTMSLRPIISRPRPRRVGRCPHLSPTLPLWQQRHCSARSTLALVELYSLSWRKMAAADAEFLLNLDRLIWDPGLIRPNCVAPPEEICHQLIKPFGGIPVSIVCFRSIYMLGPKRRPFHQVI